MQRILAAFAAVLISGSLVPGTAQAQSWTWSEWQQRTPSYGNGYHYRPDSDREFQQRMQRQQAQIARGLRDGSLTAREAQRLQSEVQRSWQLYHRFRADGRLDWRERAALDRHQDRVEHGIWRERSDRERSGIGFHQYGYRRDAYGGYWWGRR